MEIIKLSKVAIEKAVEVISSGGVIICPSDTVYGLVCDAGNKTAVEKIFKIKKRPKTKPLGVFVRDIKMAKELVAINESQEKFLNKNLPGKFTVILKKHPSYRFPESVGDKNTIGIRIIKNKFINELLEKFDKPLAQTSANISGQPATTKIGEALAQFQLLQVSETCKANLIIDAGNLPKSRPSAIIDLTHNKVKVLR